MATVEPNKQNLALKQYSQFINSAIIHYDQLLVPSFQFERTMNFRKKLFYDLHILSNSKIGSL